MLSLELVKPSEFGWHAEAFPNYVQGMAYLRLGVAHNMT